MAVVNVKIGSRNYTLSCADGEESHIQYLAKKVDKRVNEISQAVGATTSESVILAMTTLMMQDEVDDIQEKLDNSGVAEQNPTMELVSQEDQDKAVREAIDAISEYVEAIADRVEKS